MHRASQLFRMCNIWNGFKTKFLCFDYILQFRTHKQCCTTECVQKCSLYFVRWSMEFCPNGSSHGIHSAQHIVHSIKHTIHIRTVMAYTLTDPCAHRQSWHTHTRTRVRIFCPTWLHLDCSLYNQWVRCDVYIFTLNALCLFCFISSSFGCNIQRIIRNTMNGMGRRFRLNTTKPAS